MSPVGLQIIRSTQVINPTDATTLKAIETRKHKVEYGIEYDSTGRKVAIHVAEPGTYYGKTVRIPFYGNNRRFVSHHADTENPGQVRGISPLSALVYELDKLTEYDIAELEAVVASALWIASIEADVNAAPGRAPKIQPNFSNKDTSTEAPKAGLETVEVNGRALVMNNLSPGYSMKAWQPNRPNPNYIAFVEAFETHIAGALGMPLSVARQKFGSSYSAARAELLLFWNSIMVRRDNFSVFLDEFYESWFSEEVRSGRITAPRFDQPVEHMAWLAGSWNGISRPNVDPLKEVNAVEKRLKLGHTTGEKEARAYNGSDYRENVERLRNENQLLAEANSFLDADLPGNMEPDEPEDQEDE
jgi:lambda family phage portal protein